jgi:predicted NAD-dependent protein-ADP-ribosyltransferase YbiA (DUF1768 family)
MSQQHKHQQESIWCTAARDNYSGNSSQLEFCDGGTWDSHEQMETGKHAQSLGLEAKVTSSSVPAQASQLSYKVQSSLRYKWGAGKQYKVAVAGSSQTR